VTALRNVVVFGGTGFLGRRVAQHLLDHGVAVRVASRHPYRAGESFRHKASELEFVQTDIGDDRSVVAAITGTSGVVNAVSLYLEQGRQTFHSVHVEAAARVAKHSRALGVERLAHISGIGADPKSHSRYIRCRGEGEEAVRTAFDAATIIRPAVMFGPDDAFLTPLLKHLRNVGFFPMFGRGRTVLQPSYVEDVAEAIVSVFKAPDTETTYELGGPHIYTYENLLRAIGTHLGVRPFLFPVPFEAWRALALVAEMLPRPPITRTQVELMTIDNVASPTCPGFSTLGIEPHGIEVILAARGLTRDDSPSED
jgi:uncharacterized protein YbjT (DUF2867 family)